ncbi:LamG domain-containing protein, partial [Actinoplanes sp. NEAU-A12]
MIAGLGVPSLTMPAAAACSDVARTESAASELAADCGMPVVVDTLRNEYSQVIAQPDGRMTFESSVLPERVRRGAGWADVDLTLRPGSDGLLRPAASVADVAFSGGGPVPTPLVTLTRGGRTMTMSWPGLLPPPTILDNAATYSEVLSGVDLVVRATETGFTHVLKIKSAAAASAVREVRFELGGDAEVEAVDGGLRAVSNGSVLASSEPAVMWDSRTTAPAGPRTLRSLQQTPPASPSTDEVVGDAARMAPVSVGLSGGDLVLRPDAALLKDAVFPLYVDPEWSIAKVKWAYATNNGSSNSDTSTARVGHNPDTGALYRSFFQFNTSFKHWTLIGKHIESAQVEMELDHSWSCDRTVASMSWSSAINSTPKATWSSMGLLRHLASASGRANQAGGCGVIQGDEDMVFKGAAVTSLMQDASNQSWPAVAFGFTARDAEGKGESTQARWKKFKPGSARLKADYDTRPTTPTDLQVAGMPCGGGAVSVGTLSPTFTAKFHDADGGDSLTGAFEWVEVPAGGMGSVNDNSPGRRAAPPNKTNVSPGASATTATVAVEKNRTYAFRARATDESPYSQTGPWSAWCQFTVDTAVPQVKGTMISNASAPGRTVRFRIESPDADVTTFQYGWDAATKVVAASGTTPRFAEVEVTAQRFGRNVLNLKAIDATLNEGTGFFDFHIVGQPFAPVARWGLEAYPGVPQASALTDQVPAPADSPLTAANVSWPGDARLKDAQTATFNGTSSAATTSAAVVNTAGSFSVAGWVRLGALPGGDVTFATQDGADAAGFELGVRRAGATPVPYWSFALKDSSAQSSGTVAAIAPTALTSGDVGRWVHVAGSFDVVEKKVRLFVDGKKVAEVDRSAAPWSATGRFAVGRGFAGGMASGFWNGAIADVQVFDRALAPDDFTGRLASDPDASGFDEPGILKPIQVGAWDFESAVLCGVTDRRDSCEAPDPSTAWGRWLALTRGADIGAGRDASVKALWLDDQFFPSDDGTTPQTTSEYGRSAVKTGTTPPDGDGNELTLWQDRQVLRTDQSYTVSVW